METLLKDKIYISLSRWSHPPEENKGADEVYFSSDEDTSAAGMGLKTVKFNKMAPAGQTVKFRTMKMTTPAKRKRVKKANPNALLLKYAKLINEPSINSVQKPLFCSKCQGVRNSINSTEDEKTWYCGFCGGENVYAGGEIPGLEGPSVTYYLGAGVPLSDSVPEYVLIIDRSGSMSKTVAEGSSALKVLVKAIENILNEIISKNDKSRVGLIAFNRFVEIFGDCSSKKTIINEKEILFNEDKLKALANANKANFFKDPITKSKPRLMETMQNLQESGMTALGPSIVYGLEILRGSHKGRILIFTDGMSNIGVGNIECEDKKECEKQRNYYYKWTKQAREQGTSINFFAIENSAFDVSLYNPVAEQAGGAVYLVNPNNMLVDTGLPDEPEQLANTVEVTVVLPRVLRLWRVLEKREQVLPTVFRKQYGSITEKTKDIIHFVVNPEGMSRSDAEELKTLPVQVQIKWKAPDGMLNLLVVTKDFPIIMKRPKDVNMDILKDVMDKISKDMVLKGHQDEAEAELADMIDEYLAKPANAVEENLRKEAADKRNNVVESKTNTGAKTVLFTTKFKRSEDGPKTTLFKKN